MTTSEHLLPLDVTCPKCGRTDTLDKKKRNAKKFVGQWCDGSYGARHTIVRMLGAKGEPNG